MKQTPNDSGARLSGADPDSFPPLMNDEELHRAIVARRQETSDPYRRSEKPDPWPIIERSFPRIAAVIRALWGHGTLDDYFAKLVVDDRGGREGFPPEVMEAILEVALLHSQRFHFSQSMRPWEADVSERKWWNKGSF